MAREPRPARRSPIALVAAVLAAALLAGSAAGAGAQAKPEGEMRWALYVSVAPA